MSAPGEALNAFWKQLRDSSRISVVAPDVPESLRDAAGQLAVTFWKSAMQAAEDAFAVLRGEVQVQVDDARMALSAADDLAQSRRKLLDEREAELETERRVNQELSAQVSVQKDDIARLEGELAGARHETKAVSARLEETYGIHAREIQAAHTAAAQARDSFLASERRFLLDLDRERTATAKVQKQLESEQASNRRDVEKLRSEVAGLHSEAAAARQSIGLLEGQLKAAHDSLAEGAVVLQARNVELATLTERCVRAELSLEHRAATGRGEATAGKTVPTSPQGRTPPESRGSRPRRKPGKPT